MSLFRIMEMILRVISKGFKQEENRMRTGLYNLKGKIKEHNTYNGENQTILTRCTITKVEEA